VWKIGSFLINCPVFWIDKLLEIQYAVVEILAALAWLNVDDTARSFVVSQLMFIIIFYYCIMC